MKRNLLILTLVAAALSVGCASQPVVQRHGTLQEVSKHGTTYHLDTRLSGLGDNDVRVLRERLLKAGLSPAPAEKAQLIVSLSSDLRSAAERRHTGGKNGVAYDHRIDERRLSLTVTLNRPGEARIRTERRHTGGKNGVSYDHRVDEGRVLLEISSSDKGSASAETLLSAAIATLGS